MSRFSKKIKDALHLRRSSKHSDSQDSAQSNSLFHRHSQPAATDLSSKRRSSVVDHAVINTSVLPIATVDHVAPASGLVTQANTTAIPAHHPKAAINAANVDHSSPNQSTIASFYSALDDDPVSSLHTFNDHSRRSSTDPYNGELNNVHINLEAPVLPSPSTSLSHNLSNGPHTSANFMAQHNNASDSLTVLPGISEETTSFEREILQNIEQQQQRQIDEQSRLLSATNHKSYSSAQNLDSNGGVFFPKENYTTTTTTIVSPNKSDSTYSTVKGMSSTITNDQPLSFAHEGTNMNRNNSLFADDYNTALHHVDNMDSIDAPFSGTTRQSPINNYRQDLADMFTRSRTPEPTITSPVSSASYHMVSAHSHSNASSNESVEMYKSVHPRRMSTTFDASIDDIAGDSNLHHSLRSSPASSPLQRGLSRDFSALTDVNYTLQQTVDELRTKIASRNKNDEDHISALHKDYKIRIESLEQEIAMLEKTLDSNNWEMEGLRADCENNRNEISMLNSDREGLLSRLTEALSERENAVDDARVALMAERDLLKVQFETLEREFSMYKQKQIIASTTITDVSPAQTLPVIKQSVRQLVIEQVDVTGDGYPDLQTTVETATDTVAVPVANIAASKAKEISTLETEIQRYRSEIDSYKLTIKEKTDAMTHLNQEIKASQVRQVVYLDTIAKLEVQLNEQSHSMTQMSKHIANSQTQLREADSTIHELEETLETLRNQQEQQQQLQQQKFEQLQQQYQQQLEQLQQQQQQQLKQLQQQLEEQKTIATQKILPPVPPPRKSAMTSTRSTDVLYSSGSECEQDNMREKEGMHNTPAADVVTTTTIENATITIPVTAVRNNLVKGANSDELASANVAALVIADLKSSHSQSPIRNQLNHRRGSVSSASSSVDSYQENVTERNEQACTTTPANVATRTTAAPVNVTTTTTIQNTTTAVPVSVAYGGLVRSTSLDKEISADVGKLAISEMKHSNNPSPTKNQLKYRRSVSTSSLSSVSDTEDDSIRRNNFHRDDKHSHAISDINSLPTKRNIVRGVLEDLQIIEDQASRAFGFILNECRQETHRRAASASSFSLSSPGSPTSPYASPSSPALAAAAAAVLSHDHTQNILQRSLDDQFRLLEGVVSVINYMASCGKLADRDTKLWLHRIDELSELAHWIDGCLINPNLVPPMSLMTSIAGMPGTSVPTSPIRSDSMAPFKPRDRFITIVHGIENIVMENQRLHDWIGQWSRII